MEMCGFVGHLTLTIVNAVDWGSCGIACYATVSSVHFYSTAQPPLTYLYSADCKSNQITTTRFHSSRLIIAFVDSRGNLLLFDVQRRLEIGSAISNTAGADVLDIQWQHDVVIIL